MSAARGRHHRKYSANERKGREEEGTDPWPLSVAALYYDDQVHGHRGQVPTTRSAAGRTTRMKSSRLRPITSSPLPPNDYHRGEYDDDGRRRSQVVPDIRTTADPGALTVDEDLIGRRGSDSLSKLARLRSLFLELRTSGRIENGRLSESANNVWRCGNEYQKS